MGKCKLFLKFNFLQGGKCTEHLDTTYNSNVIIEMITTVYVSNINVVLAYKHRLNLLRHNIKSGAKLISKPFNV